MSLKNAVSEGMETQGILRSMSRLGTALKPGVEKRRAKKESIKRPTEKIVAQCFVSVKIRLPVCWNR